MIVKIGPKLFHQFYKMTRIKTSTIEKDAGIIMSKIYAGNLVTNLFNLNDTKLFGKPLNTFKNCTL